MKINEVAGALAGTAFKNFTQSFMQNMGDYTSADLMDTPVGRESQEITAKIAPQIYELWKHARYEIMAAGTYADWEDVPAATKQAKLEQILNFTLKKFNPKLGSLDQLKNSTDPQLRSTLDKLSAKIDAMQASVIKQGMNTPDQTALQVWTPLVQSLWQASTMSSQAKQSQTSPVNKGKSLVTMDPATNEIKVDNQPFDKTNMDQVQLVRQFFKNAGMLR